ncbi:hypothetical protein ARAM_002227 [Aspergillus rambellii]|uniref:Short chain dehydrogenase/reductase n=1 Tax=Aspergillus rambellii TaxID=308745 RepID=A0A0F8VH05_9EURO|nr:hypothetical protein ARAM_002227 [Aspergillus rambellii]
MLHGTPHSLDFTVPAVEVDLAESRALFEVNFFAVVHMCQTFLPLLMRAQGTIVQIGSITGVLPYAFGSIYNASKAALLAFSDTLRVELAPFGVHVSVVITGYVQSRIARTKRMLREDSLYQPLRVEYEHRLTHSQQGSMPHDVYARRVVARLLDPVWPCWWPRQGRARPSRWIWEGGWSKLVMVSVGGWLWLGLWEWIFTWMLKLWKLQRK